jgi:hypothetical protein
VSHVKCLQLLCDPKSPLSHFRGHRRHHTQFRRAPSALLLIFAHEAAAVADGAAAAGRYKLRRWRTVAGKRLEETRHCFLRVSDRSLFSSFFSRIVVQEEFNGPSCL